MSSLDKLDRRVERYIKFAIGCVSVAGISVIMLIVIGIFHLFN